MKRVDLIKKISMVCVGAERVDSYEAEGYIVKDGHRYIAFIVEKEKDKTEKLLGVWYGEFSELDEALKALRNVQYDLGRMNDRGFGCHEALDYSGDDA